MELPNYHLLICPATFSISTKSVNFSVYFLVTDIFLADLLCKKNKHLNFIFSDFKWRVQFLFFFCQYLEDSISVCDMLQSTNHKQKLFFFLVVFTIIFLTIIWQTWFCQNTVFAVVLFNLLPLSSVKRSVIAHGSSFELKFTEFEITFILTVLIKVDYLHRSSEDLLYASHLTNKPQI